MYKIGDEVIEKSSGRKGRIISMGLMAEMCYEIKFPDSIYNALKFAREISPARGIHDENHEKMKDTKNTYQSELWKGLDDDN